MKDPTSIRTPHIIAAEINAINLESRKMLLVNAGGPNSQPVGNLTYTQARLLLGLPQEERAEFGRGNTTPSAS